MSVIAIADHTIRTARRHPPLPPAHPTHRQQLTGDAPAGAQRTQVTIELAVNGEAEARLLDVLEAIRDALTTLGSGSVTIRNTPEQVTPHHPEQPQHPVIEHGSRALRVVPDERSVWRGSEEIKLSRLEFDLLLFFAEHPRQVFTRIQLLKAVWGYTQTGTRTIDVHVRRVRMKLGDSARFLTTIRGVGYRLDSNSPITILPSGQSGAAVAT